MTRIVVTGATGFVGSHVIEELEPDEFIATSRNPKRAAEQSPDIDWRALDLDDETSIRNLLEPGDRIVYLVHSMDGGKGYAERESAAAERFTTIGKEVGIDRIVYLGGPEPPGNRSEHLKSRLQTGEILRNSGIPTFELQAGMIMGAGSESWVITRDLSVRLPVMLVPRWLQHLCEPVSIHDVVAALIHALSVEPQHAGVWGLPGPDRLTYAEVLNRVARLRGTKPLTFPVPFLTPKLSSHWLRLVTRANMNVARELVAGLNYDLVCDPDEAYWKLMPSYARIGFDEAATRALRAESRELSLGTRVLERGLKVLFRSG